MSVVSLVHHVHQSANYFKLLTFQNAWSSKQFLSCGGFQKFHLTSSPFHNKSMVSYNCMYVGHKTAIGSRHTAVCFKAIVLRLLLFRSNESKQISSEMHFLCSINVRIVPIAQDKLGLGSNNSWPSFPRSVFYNAGDITSHITCDQSHGHTETQGDEESANMKHSKPNCPGVEKRENNS